MTECKDRVDAVRRKFGDAGIDGLLVTHPTNRRYLTGFTAGDTPPNESSGHLIVSSTDLLLVTGSVNVTQAESQAPHVRVVNRDPSWAACDAEAIRQMGIHRVGYEAHAMLEGVFRAIGEAFKDVSYEFEWVAVDGLVEELRAVKSPGEIAAIKKAFEITNATFERIAPTIEAGQTEAEVAWKIYQSFIELGAEGPAFPTIVAAGTNAARPHHEPGTTIIAEGQPIVIDMGAKFNGYCADLTRTVWVGEPGEQLQAVYPVVAAAVEQVLERLSAGVSGSEMDAVARDYIDQHGFGEAFTHGLGHGVGLRVHEAPSFNKRSEDILARGNTITIEPGVYLPEWGGVRVEDVVLMTDDGFEVLTTASKKYITHGSSERIAP